MAANRTGRGVLRSGMVRIGSMGCTVVASVVLARRLGGAQFGAYAVSFFTVFVGAYVVAAGVGRSGLRSVAGLLVDGREDDAAGLTRSIVPVFVVSGPMGFVVASTLCALSTPRSLVPLQSCAVVGLMAVGSGILMAVSDLLRAWDHQVLADATTGPNGLVPSLLFVVPLVALSSRPLTTLLWLQMLAYCIPALVALWWLGRHRAGDVIRRVRDWIRDGHVVMWANLAGLINGSADVWVASRVLDRQDVGHYAAASRLAALVTVPQGIAQMSQVRDMVRLLKLGNHPELQRRLRRSSTLTLLLAAPALVALLVPRLVLRELLGEEYQSAAPVLVVLTVAQLVNVGSGLCGLLLTMSGNERVTLVSALFAGGLTVVGGLLAGRWFGLAGLGVASALATASMFVWMLVGARRRVGIWTHSDALPPFRPLTAGEAM